MTACMQCHYWNRVSGKPPVDNVTSLENYFQTNRLSVIPMLLKSIGTTLEQFV